MNLDMDVDEVTVSLAVPEEAGEALEGSIVVFRVKMDIVNRMTLRLQRWSCCREEQEGTSKTTSCSNRVEKSLSLEPRPEA